MIRLLVLLAVLVAGYGFFSKKKTEGPVSASASASPVRPAVAGKTHTLVDNDPDYAEAVIHGWRVLVSKQLLGREGNLALQALNLLDAQLGDIQAKLPLRAVQELQAAPIWLELQTPGLRGAQYHWSAD